MLSKGKIKNPDITTTPFIFIQGSQEQFYNASKQMLKGIRQEDILGKVFFHPRNVKIIQSQLQKQVYIASGKQWIIEEQDETDVYVVMRSIFLSYARHDPNIEIRDQIKELNNLTVDSIVPGIISEIRANLGYLEKIFTPLQVMDRPQNVSVAGKQSIPALMQK